MSYAVDKIRILSIILKGIVIQVGSLFLCQLDYNQLCHVLLCVVRDNDNPYTIINLGRRGGLGHKFGFMMHSLSLAILLKRNYLSHG